MRRGVSDGGTSLAQVHLCPCHQVPIPRVPPRADSVEVANGAHRHLGLATAREQEPGSGVEVALRLTDHGYA